MGPVLFKRKLTDTWGFDPHVKHNFTERGGRGRGGSKTCFDAQICSSCSVIVRVSVVLKRTVGDSD